MAAIYIHRFGSLAEVNNFVRGGIRFPRNFKGNERIYGLHGLTLVFGSPTGTVTFADANNAGLSVQEIMAEIMADVATLQPYLRDGVLYLLEATPSSGVSLTDGTARAVFGFPTGTNVSGTKYAAPGGSAPALIGVADTGSMDGFIVTTEE